IRPAGAKQLKHWPPTPISALQWARQDARVSNQATRSITRPACGKRYSTANDMSVSKFAGSKFTVEGRCIFGARCLLEQIVKDRVDDLMSCARAVEEIL